MILVLGCANRLDDLKTGYMAIQIQRLTVW